MAHSVISWHTGECEACHCTRSANSYPYHDRRALTFRVKLKRPSHIREKQAPLSHRILPRLTKMVPSLVRETVLHMVLNPSHSCSETYKNREAEVAAKVKRLLDRKGKKTEAGRVLIEDIERLVSEVGIIAGSHV